MKQEVNKKTELGQKIFKQQKAYQYIDDQIVTDLVKEQIDRAEMKGDSWILQGFPRTKVQALAL